MALSTENERILRQWVGDGPLTADLEDLYTQTGSYDQVVLMTLRLKIAQFAEQPSQVTVPGLTVGFQSNTQTLQQTIKDFIAAGGTGLDTSSVSGIQTATIIRHNSVR